MSNIPKIIHYCWFGGNSLPELARICIDSWKKNLPDYEIKEWNETNYDVEKIPYIAQAYKEKKYAFVSDYARFDILYQYGGIYFDTDVEVIQDLSPIIEQGAFMGLEKGYAPLINAGLGIACPAGIKIYEEILNSYKNEIFRNDDGTLNLKTVVTRVTDIFKQHGFVEEDKNQNISNINIFSSEYFCPKSIITGITQITKNTYSIHHYDASWTSMAQKKFDSQRMFLRLHFGVLGKVLIIIPFLIWQINDYGVLGLLKKIRKRINK